jgi:anti-sigma B factor antagonist
MIDLDITVNGEGAERVLHLEGTCDLASAPKFKEVLTGLRPPGVKSIVIDVSGLEFVDSTGLGLMLGALRRLRESGGTLKIAGAHGAVLRVLEVTDLDKVIPLFPDVETARSQ